VAGPVTLHGDTINFICLKGSAAWCSHSINAYLDRFGFHSPLLKAMYAATDGTSAFTGSWNDAGTGANFLLHQMVHYAAATRLTCDSIY
jgi:hypothetical protein